MLPGAMVGFPGLVSSLNRWFLLPLLLLLLLNLPLQVSRYRPEELRVASGDRIPGLRRNVPAGLSVRGLLAVRQGQPGHPQPTPLKVFYS